MGKTVYHTATSIDGYIADKDNSLQWLFDVDGGEMPELDGSEEAPDGTKDDFDAFISEVGAACSGSTTYEWVLDAAGIRDKPETWPYKFPTWVLTSKEREGVPGADIRFHNGDVREAHRQMKEAAGDKDIWIIGGGDLAGQFADAGLLDEVTVTVAPVFLGGGAPLLPRRMASDRLTLENVNRQRQFVNLTYSVDK
ncbi:dihydrofolate reductase family protein [Salininema proteolyticum]|uniref:Dihydrofolate reductase family protein n=1 Tax=Salininema proteolyticum TaxID=1607685 RepID=A0ABV8TZ86_9ACTN